MGKKNKNKPKKVSVKKERYSKFRKDKPGVLNITMPDLSEEQQKQKRDDENKIDRFLRFAKNPPVKEIVERKVKSKR
ncbi:hypothetical protein KO361_03350 [Candidatus Woesearchaeota archaeon]|nr:hypothetical protein [Candidatus Woesearchaeota archaeon]